LNNLKNQSPAKVALGFQITLDGKAQANFKAERTRSK
jgi:hypothetical protein